MLHFYYSYITPLSVLIPIFFGIKYYTSFSIPFKIIFWFVVFSGIVNALSLSMLALKMQTLIVIHFYTIFEFMFLSFFYRSFQNKTGQNLISGLVSMFSILCLVNFLFFQKISSFNTYTRTFEAVIVIAYSVQFIFRQSNINSESTWEHNGLNWLNAGIFTYYGSGLFFFMTSNYFLHAGTLINDFLWSVIDTMLIVEYILFAIGFYKCKQQQTISL